MRQLEGARTLRVYVIISTTAAMLILLGTFLLILSRYAKSDLADDVSQRLEASQALFSSYLESDALMMRNALDLVLRDKELKAAMRARDRQRLHSLSEPVFRQLYREAKITHFYFTGRDRVNILRVHKPERYGDRIDRVTTLEAENTGKPSNGIELGPLGTFTLRVVVPWFDGKELIGYVELGEEIEHLIEKVHKILEVDLFVLIEKPYLKRSEWEAGMKMLGHDAEWERFPSVVMVAQTRKIFPEALSAVFMTTRHVPMMKRTEFSLDGARYSGGFARIKDAGGRDVGTMVMMSDITLDEKAHIEQINAAVGVCFLVGACLLFALYIFFRRVESERERAVSLLRATIESTAEGILVVDNHGGITEFNQRFLRMWGIPESMLRTGDHGGPLAFATEQVKDPEGFIKKIRDIYGQPDAETNDVVEFKDGRVFERFSQPQRAQGKTVGRLWSFRDITERRSGEEALKQSEARYRMLFANMLNGFAYHEIILDEEGTPIDYRFLEVNDAFERVIGMPRENVIGKRVTEVMPGIGDSAFDWIGSYGEVAMTGKQARFEQYAEFLDKWFSVLVFSHQKGYFATVIEDITVRKRMEEELRALSLVDELTGVYNRRGFLTIAKQQVRIADRMKKEMLLIFADVDRMKIINDTFGHQEGDRALIDTANILRAALRDSDIISRFGGDEFVILAMEACNEHAQIIYDRLQENIRSHNERSERPYKLSLSIGLICYVPGSSLDELLMQADQLMYQDKQKKRAENGGTGD